MFFQLYNAAQKAPAEKILNKALINTNYDIYLTINLFSNNDPNSKSNNGNSYGATIVSIIPDNSKPDTSIQTNSKKQLLNLLLKQADDPIDVLKPFVQVQVTAMKNNQPSSLSYSYYQTLSDESIKAIRALYPMKTS